MPDGLRAAEFRRAAQAHSLWRHPFLARCRAGELTLAEVRVLGAQMYKFCREFPHFLAIAMTLCEAEDARMVIGENLWEELGEGQPELTHAALFRRFTRALGLDDATLEAVPALPETAELIATYVDLGQRWGMAGLLGALCYASEGIVAALYTHLCSGLMRTQAFTREDLIFFEVHIQVDDGHADKLESVLLPCLRVPALAHNAEAAIREAMDARCRFFDGVMRAAPLAADQAQPLLAC